MRRFGKTPFLIPAALLILSVGAAAAIPGSTGRAQRAALAAHTLAATSAPTDRTLSYNAVLQKAAAAPSVGTVMDVGGLGTLAVQVTGTFTGEIHFEGTVDGTNWELVAGVPAAGGNAITSVTDAGLWIVSITGLAQFRANAVALTSGAVTVTAKAVTQGAGGAGGAGGGGGGGGQVAIADGVDQTQGSINDAAVNGDNPGTVSAKLRGLNLLAADVWDSANHFLNVSMATALSSSIDSVTTATVDGGNVTLGTKADAAVGDASGTLMAHVRFIDQVMADVHDGANHFLNVNLLTSLDHTLDSVGAWTADGQNVTLGLLADAAVGDASGSVNAHLRQIAKVLTAGSPTTLIAGAVNAGAYVSGSVLAGAYADGSIVTIGANADAATSGAGTLNAHARQVALNTANIPANGQAAMAGSLPVAIANNQSALPVTQSGTWTVQPGNTANTTAWKVDGSAVTQPVSVAATLAASPTAGTTGGATPYSYIAAASANQDSQVIKNTAGTLYSIEVFNTSGALKWLKIYDKATSPTSADTPVARYPVPFNATASDSAGFVSHFTVGRAFASGIAFRMTGAGADNDATPVSASDLILNAGTK